MIEAWTSHIFTARGKACIQKRTKKSTLSDVFVMSHATVADVINMLGGSIHSKPIPIIKGEKTKKKENQEFLKVNNCMFAHF